MIDPGPCSRRRALALLGRAAATLLGIAAFVGRGATYTDTSGTSQLDVPTIVGLHLEQLARCGAAGGARVARIGSPLLAAARRHAAPTGARATEVAFALLEQFGEFPPLHRPFGGSQ